MNLSHSRCLVLNADYTPLTIINWKKAFIWSMRYEHEKNSVEIVDFYKNDYIIGTNNKKYPIPAVAKTRKYFRINHHSVKFSRKNLFIRDNHTCQYCNNIFDTTDLTYDHVIPKSLWKSQIGTPTCWTNIVTACVHCNSKKGNRTPKQANMPLKTMPIVPQKNCKYLPVTHHLFKIKKDIPQEWMVYLPESYLI
jgi:hypothetical protein